MWKEARKSWNQLLGNRRFVFVHDKPLDHFKLPDGMVVKRYERQSDLPPDELQKTLDELGPDYVFNWLETEFTNKGVFWQLFVDGECAAREWTRRGDHFNKWFVQLKDEDIVIFAVSTFPEWRGRGLCSLLTKCVITQERCRTGRAYIDVLRWNRASVRAFKKAGFKYIGSMKHYKEN